MKKLEKIERDAQKAREKISAMQAILKQIEGQRTEQENLQIVQQIRALKMSRDELYAFLNGGELPASLAAAFGSDGNAAESDSGTDSGSDTSDAPEPETIYSRRGKKRNTGNETGHSTETPGADIETNETPDTENGFGETPHYESEDMTNEG